MGVGSGTDEGAGCGVEVGSGAGVAIGMGVSSVLAAVGTAMIGPVTMGVAAGCETGADSLASLPAVGAGVAGRLRAAPRTAEASVLDSSCDAVVGAVVGEPPFPGWSSWHARDMDIKQMRNVPQTRDFTQ